MITRNLEQVIIPQPSVPHRTTKERGHTTERPTPVANSCQNHFSTVDSLATKSLKVLTSPDPYLLQSCHQSWQQTPSIAQQKFSNSSVPPQSTSIHVPSSTAQSVTFWELPTSVNNRGLSRQQHMYSYFFVISKDKLNKQIITSTE